MLRFILACCLFASAAAHATSPFSRTSVQAPTATALAGSSTLWDGYHNVFYSEGTALVQRYWAGTWARTVVDHRSSPPHPSCNKGTNGEISSQFINGYHDIFYISFNNTELRHAFFNYAAGVWICETIESGAMAHPSAIDLGGYPHVYYVDITRGVLRHAFWTGSAWQKEDIDGLGLSGPGQCNCRVTGIPSNSPALRPVAALSFLSTQQVFYRNNDTGALRYAYSSGGGGGGWTLWTAMGPNSNLPGANLPNTVPVDSHIAVTAVGSSLHVFVGHYSNRVRHLWWSPYNGWRLSTQSLAQVFQPNSSGANLSFSATRYHGGWSLLSWSRSYYRVVSGVHQWGQEDNATLLETFEPDYYPAPTFTGAENSWIDAFEDGEGYLNVHVTHRNPDGLSLHDQFWR